MRPNLIFLTLTTIAAVAVIGFAIKDHSARGEAERVIADRQAQRARLETETHGAEQRLADLEGEQRRVQAALETLRKKSSPAASEASPKPPAMQPATVLRNAILNDPHLQNLQLAVAQSKLIATYQPLCEQLNLTAAQTEKFLAILQKRGEQQMDLSAIKETQRTVAGDPVFTTLEQQLTNDFRTAQTVLLGEAGYRQLETYERSVSARELVNEIAGATSVAGIGLTSGQADALVKAMTEASPVYQRGGLAMPKNIEWSHVIADAATTLSPPQLALFKNAVTQFHNMDQLRELAQRSAKPGGG